MILAIDFDGTLHMAQFPAIGPELPYAAECMRQLAADGHYIIINTCRSRDEIIEVVNWLLEKKIPFNRINDNHPDMTAAHDNNSRKVYADVYIDDKQVGGLPTWPEIVEWVRKVEKKNDGACGKTTVEDWGRALRRLSKCAFEANNLRYMPVDLTDCSKKE